jgi:hypothetical protein
MRVVREISHPDCKITIYHWNNRYLVKIEQGTLEQTFKVPEFDLTSEEDLLDALDAEFLHQTLERFRQMGQSFHEARVRAGW